MEGEIISHIKFNIPASYRFHKNESMDIPVDIWRLNHPNS